MTSLRIPRKQKKRITVLAHLARPGDVLLLRMNGVAPADEGLHELGKRLHAQGVHAIMLVDGPIEELRTLPLEERVDLARMLLRGVGDEARSSVAEELLCEGDDEEMPSEFDEEPPKKNVLLS